jgi:hypothetical protein
LVAGLGFVLSMPALAAAAGTTTTTMTTPQASTATSMQGGVSAPCSLTSFTVNVTSTSGVPTGTVTINDGSTALATATLNSSGQANFVFALENGPHSLTATFASTTFGGSTSAPSSVSISSQCTSDFVVTATSLSPSTTADTITVTAGQQGTGMITIVPLQSWISTLSGPAFVTISCSGLSDLAACSFTPESVEILPSQNAGVASSMVLTTYAASSTSLTPAKIPGNRSTPVAWAFLLPGVLGLGGLAFGARRRRSLSRLSLVALVGLVTVLGATGCNPRYNYEHHGPPANPATPAGTYTVEVTAQNSNGITAVNNSTPVTLIVN